MESFDRGSEWRKWDLHLHTKSSYDYKYNGDDADQLLCDELKKNNISAVAITDHFVIDKDRIENLRKLAPDIVFFPGVELRTDKGAANLHIILIFDYKADLKTLSDDFEAIMIRTKSKSRDNMEKIYWDFDDIVEFAKNHKGIISIHAGRKSNGVDDMITNSLPAGQAIKEEIAENIHFFEMGKLSDFEEYRKKVFTSIKEKPMIICSDNHNPNEYALKENLWIKADLTFEGLIQCIYQPNERVFVGVKPPKLDKIDQKNSNYIDELKIKRKDEPKNKTEEWFDVDLKLNPGLIAVIGNKGSGKSALSDILALGCNSKNMLEASFLNENRFMKKPKNLADDYKVEITWRDQNKDEVNSLTSNIDQEYTIENAQYLPQKFIEKICNDLENEFQEEINKVIFSYVDKIERGNTKNLNQLIHEKTINIRNKIDELQLQLREINRNIIKDEEQLTKSYKEEVKANYLKRKNDLERLEKSKPKEVKKPKKVQSKKYMDTLESLNNQIAEINIKIAKIEKDLIDLKEQNSEINSLEYSINDLQIKVNEINDNLPIVAKKLNIEETDFKVRIEFPSKILKTKKIYLTQEIDKLVKTLDIENNKSLIAKKKSLESQKEELISKSDAQEKEYQKYLQDLEEWNKNKEEIIGNKDKENSIEALEIELDYIENQLPSDYEEHRNNRVKKITEIFEKKKEITDIYKSIYTPVEKEIKRILNDVDSKINFSTNIVVQDKEFGSRLLSYVSKSYNGIFSGKTESINTINNMLKDKDFNNVSDVLKFIEEVLECIYEDIDNSSKKVKNKQEFYQLLCNLNYIDIVYSLKVDKLSLQELSPGERGIVLLIFYLALSKEDIPIIIDQPEDNLDNQSVYDKLVPCICEAKKKRQVVIVTHNPNIAIACDAEQIIYCNIDKNNNKIFYKSGSIENLDIRKKVIDILEGTMPAFDLRRRKYMD